MSQLFKKGKTTLLGLTNIKEQDFNGHEPTESRSVNIEKSGFDGTLECLYEHWRI